MKTPITLFLNLLLVMTTVAQMPSAITIEPPFATAYDTLTLIFDPAEACIQSGSLAGLDSIAIHSGVTYQDGPNWQCVVRFDSAGFNGQSTTLFPTGDGRFSITYVPFEFYAFPNGAVVTEICAVFNNGTNWNQDGRDFEDEIICKDFFIPLAYSCLPEGITFTTQEQIDNFPYEHPYCTEIEGDVEINGDDITNLNGLNGLISIEGDFTVSGNNVLSNLVGLENLIFIGGDINIGYWDGEANQSLTSLSGLENITSIGGTLRVGGPEGGNPSLINLSGLDNLTSIGENLLILSNNALTSLTGLENLNNIGWSLIIEEEEYLTTLSGLENLDFIGGKLLIYGCDALISLQSLNNLDTIMGRLCIGFLNGSYYGNASLTNLIGLNSLTFIGEGIEILGNDSLINLTGLEGITHLPGNLEIVANSQLLNLTGLGSLTSIGGKLDLVGNYELTSLTAIENLTSIGDNLHLEHNESLVSLAGLDNIDAGSISNLDIHSNDLLSTCNAQCICDYIASPNGTIVISNNAPGCNSQQEVEEACASCLPEGITFTTQTQIDSFQIVHPNCTEIEGDVFISGDNITNLNGLSVLTSIGDSLDISNNTHLTSLTGLDNLTSIGGNLEIYNNAALESLTGLDNLTSIGQNLYVYYNDSLTSLTGLDNLTSVGHTLYFYSNNSLTNLTGLDNLPSIGGSLVIDYNPVLNSLTGLDNLTSIGLSFTINENNSLTSLTGLDNLTSIGGSLAIIETNSLTSLTGLDNIDANSIINLYIIGNSFLSACEVQSICDYIVSPGGTIEIDNNAPGCNSQEEVKEACASSVNELRTLFGIKTQPNPFSTSTTIEYHLSTPQTVILSFYNQFGKEVDQIEQKQSAGKQQVVWTPELPGGVYYFRLEAGEQTASGKVVLVR